MKIDRSTKRNFEEDIKIYAEQTEKAKENYENFWFRLGIKF